MSPVNPQAIAENAPLRKEKLALPLLQQSSVSVLDLVLNPALAMTIMGGIEMTAIGEEEAAAGVAGAEVTAPGEVAGAIDMRPLLAISKETREIEGQEGIEIGAWRDTGEEMGTIATRLRITGTAVRMMMNTGRVFVEGMGRIAMEGELSTIEIHTTATGNTRSRRSSSSGGGGGMTVDTVVTGIGRSREAGKEKRKRSAQGMIHIGKTVILLRNKILRVKGMEILEGKGCSHHRRCRKSPTSLACTFFFCFFFP